MGKLSIFRLIREQLRPVPPVARGDLTGKTVMMVGCNTGLGFEATKHLCRMGPARVILAARSEARGQHAIREIAEATGVQVELWLVDLASLQSVLGFAEKFAQDGGRLDFLVYNAAVLELEYSVTVDGYEATWVFIYSFHQLCTHAPCSIAVNHISAAVLSLALLPQLMETAAKHGGRPRIVQVTSDLHYWTTFTREVLDSPSMFDKLSEKGYCTTNGMGTRYHLSKLMNVMFVRRLTAHLPAQSPVVFNAVHPGYCLSGLRRRYTWPMMWFDALMERCLARTTEEGSRQIVFAVVGHPDAEADRMKAAYVTLDCVIGEESDYIFTPEGQQAEKKLWDETLAVACGRSQKICAIVNEYLTK